MYTSNTNIKRMISLLLGNESRKALIIFLKTHKDCIRDHALRTNQHDVNDYADRFTEKYLILYLIYRKINEIRMAD